jgi:KipI family sensor histidine kinase inhibitor
VTTADFSIDPVGDASLLVSFGAGLDVATHARVIHTAAAIRHQAVPGVRDVVPAFDSLAVSFDPLRTDLDRLTAIVAAAASTSERHERPPAVTHEVPVRYGGSAGPDLEAVAEAAGLSSAEVIAIHAAVTYRVFMIGFTPGFAYMGPVDARIATARRPTPRVRVPAGSVGIAGRQTGIYPSDTPGGWMLVGRTQIRPFDPSRERPFLFAPGDAVRFVPEDEGAPHPVGPR